VTRRKDQKTKRKPVLGKLMKKGQERRASIVKSSKRRV